MIKSNQNNFNKVLVICGPTSTGKTSLALRLAKKINAEIISADSRQVYIGMNIGTGKDIPDGSSIRHDGSYEVDGVKIWGYDLASPKEDFSVSHYLKFARGAMEKISAQNKLAILVGGTGLYIKAAIDGIDTANIPRNDSLRITLESKSAADLYESLSQMDPIKAGSLNTSDKYNPRRLIRAIEVAQYHLSKKDVQKNHSPNKNLDTLFVGLSAPLVYLRKRIVERVNLRVKQGIKKEIKQLFDSGVGWDSQSMMAIGYRGWRDYFEGEVGEDIVVNDWILDEVKYAKRQMVWFKKEPRIVWFDISKADYVENVELLVEKWYI